MRTSARITTGLSAAALAFALTACGGGSTTADSTASTKQPATPVAPTTPPAKAVPAGQVCDKFSKEDVGQATGKTFFSASDVDLLAGASPTVCYYYTDSEEVDNVGIQWMTLKQALWQDQVDTTTAAPNPSPADMEAVHTRVKGLGDDAVKEVVVHEGKKTIGYYVLTHGIVVYISTTDATKVPDAALVNLGKMITTKL